MVGVNLWFGIAVTFMVVGLSIAGLLLVRRKLDHSALQLHHDVADPLLSVVGTMFAVLLGFMVANAMSRFEEARITVQQEAGALADVFRLSNAFPEQEKLAVQHLCVSYAAEVINDEWPRLGRKEFSTVAWKTYIRLWKRVTQYNPPTQVESNAQQVLFDAMTRLSDSRRLRIGALHYGLPPQLWGVLLMGGVCTILFTYFFGIENVRLQILMTAVVSLVICLNIFLLATYDDPFSGDVMVKPIPFEIVLGSFRGDEAAKYSY